VSALQHERAVEAEEEREEQLVDVRTQPIIFAANDLVEEFVGVAYLTRTFTHREDHAEVQDTHVLLGSAEEHHSEQKLFEYRGLYLTNRCTATTFFTLNGMGKGSWHSRMCCANRMVLAINVFTIGRSLNSR